MIDGHWLAVRDGDIRALALYKRHYSFHKYTDNRRTLGHARTLILGPGEKSIYITANCDALIAWRKFIDHSGEMGVNCAVFRNEGPLLSSALILEAEQLAWARWPGERLYTYVNGAVVKGDGKCFKAAGWRKLNRRTKSGLIILEKYPEEIA